MLDRRLALLVAVLIWISPLAFSITRAPAIAAPASGLERAPGLDVAPPTAANHSLIAGAAPGAPMSLAPRLMAERRPGPLLDIARVVPYPADFAGAIPGLGFLSGRFYSLDEEAARTAAAANAQSALSIRDSKRLLAEAGWLQRYENRLAAPIPEDGKKFSVQISSFVVEYASATDAHAAFSTLTADTPAGDSPVVGEESVVSQFTGVTTDTKTNYLAARVIYRVGPMIGMIVFADLHDQQPDVGLLLNVAQLVAARAAVVNDRQSDPLGSMVLQLDRSEAIGAVSLRDIYDVRAGVLTPLYGDNAEAESSRVNLFSPMSDAFVSTTSGTFTSGNLARVPDSATPVAAKPTPTSVITIDEASPVSSVAPTPASDATNAARAPSEAQRARVTLISALYAFAQAPDAEAWISTQRTILQDQKSQFREVTDAPRLGDGSATFEISGAGGFRIYARVGSIVSVLEMRSSPGVSLNGAARLMSAQVQCVEEDGCASDASLPKSIFGGVDPPVSATPKRSTDEEKTPTAAPEPIAAPVELPAVTPVAEVAPAPVEEPVATAAEEPVASVPAESEPTAAPAELSTDESTPPPPDESAPAADATPPAATESDSTPTPELTPQSEEPTESPASEPATPPVEEPTSEPVAESTSTPPAAESTSTPTAEEPSAPLPGPVANDGEPGASDAGSVSKDGGKDKTDRNRRKDRSHNNQG